jgi:hypothetical protein
MRFVASHQSPETTRSRLATGETFVAVRDGWIVGIETLADARHTHGSPFLDRPDVRWADVNYRSVVMSKTLA